MDHAIRIVASSVGFSLRTIEAPLNRWMQEGSEKQACWPNYVAAYECVRPCTNKQDLSAWSSRQDRAPIHIEDLARDEAGVLCA